MPCPYNKISIPFPKPYNDRKVKSKAEVSLSPIIGFNCKIVLVNSSRVMTNMYSIENRAEIISIRQFVALEAIRIPEYQRPYKWTAKNVLQLVDDIHTFRKKSHYRFGTIVIHINTIKENDGNRTYYDIVDGQQRYITLRLPTYGLPKIRQNNPKNQTQYKGMVARKYEKVKKIPITFKHKLTIGNFSANFRNLQKAIQHYDDETITQF